MACPERDQLELLLAKRLAETAREELETHVEDCDACQQVLELLTEFTDWEPMGNQEGDPSHIRNHAGKPAAAAVGLGRLGGYRIARELGRGGMGVVYEAEHESLKNRVALKVMHARFRDDRTYVRRFRIEARAAAKLHHTNIVSVFDYGEQDGVCYYAMQCIDGVSLERVLQDVRRLRAAADCGGEVRTGVAGEGTATDPGADPPTAISRGLLSGRFEDAPTGSFVAGSNSTTTAAIDRATTGVKAGVDGSASASSGGGAGSGSSSLGGQRESIYFRELARLGAQVADALDYAHRQRVIHRDIKPSNLMLDTRGNLWVSDFGLAKLLEGDDLSHSHELVGTMRFMAPERFRGITDSAGDVYALGATLYELLCLKPAFAERDQARLIDQITHKVPAPLRQHDRRIPRDLETLVQKALAKDPRDRFGSAGELAEELRRYLESRPIRSRPVGLPERIWRWSKRSPGLAAACVAAAALLVFVAVGSSMAAWKFNRDARRLQLAERATRENLFDSLFAQAEARRFSGRMGQRFESLRAIEQASAIARELNLPADRVDRLRDEAIACLALPDLRETGRAIHRPAGAFLVAVDPASLHYALRFPDRVQVHRVSDEVEVDRFPAQGDREINVFDFSPDGKYLATKNWPGDAVTVRDIGKRAVVLEDPGPVSWTGAKFSPDGRRIAFLRPNGETLIYALATGRRLQSWPGPPGGMDIAFRADGAVIATLHDQPDASICRIVEGDSGRVLRTIDLPSKAMAVAWSPDGKTVATACDGSPNVHLFDVATGQRKVVLDGLADGGLSVWFHPSGTLLARNGWENRLRLWDANLGRPILSVTAHHTGRSGFRPDGSIVIVNENTATVYEVNPGQEYRTLAHPVGDPSRWGNVTIRSDGRVLAVATALGVSLWDLARGTELGALWIGGTWAVLFDSSGDLITLSQGWRGVQRWPVLLQLARGEFRIGPPRRLALNLAGGLAADRSGKTIAVARSGWADVVTPEGVCRAAPLDDVRYVAVSPDGKRLATCSHTRGVQVWRIQDVAATKLAELPDCSGSIEFSPDGELLLTRSSPCALWEPATLRLVREIGGMGLSFAPDGRSLVVQDPDRALRIVETATGRTLARLEAPQPFAAGYAAFSPDGTFLAMSTNDGPAVLTWDLRAIRRRLKGMGLDWGPVPNSASDSASMATSPLPLLHVKLGRMDGHDDDGDHMPNELIATQERRIAKDPRDAEAYHRRGHALAHMSRFREAVDDLSQAILLRPGDPHLLFVRGTIHYDLEQWEQAITDIEAAQLKEPVEPAVRVALADCYDQLRYKVASAPNEKRDVKRAVELGRRALALAPNDSWYLMTLGAALYRAGRLAESIEVLKRGLAASQGQFDGFDLFFLALAYHRLGQNEAARGALDRGVRWSNQQTTLGPRDQAILNGLRAEAEAALASTYGDLPENVLAPPPQKN